VKGSHEGSPISAGRQAVSDAGPEVPEPELSRAERGAERRRLRVVRRERRREAMTRANRRKKGKKGKGDKKR